MTTKKIKKTPTKKPSVKYPKLKGKAHVLAGKFIAEEIAAGYPRKQAIAIGLSRARATAAKATPAKRPTALKKARR